MPFRYEPIEHHQDPTFAEGVKGDRSYLVFFVFATQLRMKKSAI
jgi:hypothetical protein